MENCLRVLVASPEDRKTEAAGNMVVTGTLMSRREPQSQQNDALSARWLCHAIRPLTPR